MRLLTYISVKKKYLTTTTTTKRWKKHRKFDLFVYKFTKLHYYLYKQYFVCIFVPLVTRYVRSVTFCKHRVVVIVGLLKPFDKTNWKSACTVHDAIGIYNGWRRPCRWAPPTKSLDGAMSSCNSIVYIYYNRFGSRTLNVYLDIYWDDAHWTPLLFAKVFLFRLSYTWTS